MLDIEQEQLRVFGVERVLIAKQLVKNDSERPAVGFHVITPFLTVFLGQNFWCYVRNRSDFSIWWLTAVKIASKAEVREFDLYLVLAVNINQEVFKFYISMHYIILMAMDHRFHHLLKHIPHLIFE